jgi:hypothetical protein
VLVDSTGLRLCGPGGWLEEKHGSKRRRAWKVLHLGTDAGQIVTSLLTGRDADDGSQVGPLLDRVDGSVTSFTGWRLRPGRCLRRGRGAASRCRHHRPSTRERGAKRHGRDRTNPARRASPMHR